MLLFLSVLPVSVEAVLFPEVLLLAVLSEELPHPAAIAAIIDITNMSDTVFLFI